MRKDGESEIKPFFLVFISTLAVLRQILAIYPPSRWVRPNRFHYLNCGGDTVKITAS
jgi:hypothetical protein